MQIDARPPLALTRFASTERRASGVHSTPERRARARATLNRRRTGKTLEAQRHLALRTPPGRHVLQRPLLRRPSPRDMGSMCRARALAASKRGRCAAMRPATPGPCAHVRTPCLGPQMLGGARRCPDWSPATKPDLLSRQVAMDFGEPHWRPHVSWRPRWLRRPIHPPRPQAHLLSSRPSNGTAPEAPRPRPRTA